MVGAQIGTSTQNKTQQQQQHNDTATNPTYSQLTHPATTKPLWLKIKPQRLDLSLPPWDPTPNVELTADGDQGTHLHGHLRPLADGGSFGLGGG